ncbi:Oidioi.mRNA.OKI2018_I69.XSR.g14692.t1.cds [Oikopleura dioica]|uniref:Sulfotransferase n=1 Tax=Oikopleura dioica TaxID=34765 RepID=A0ABN7SHV2_OIKDI|nr:Oidioi.mRNA.OKI2018_I69.XSR.g14692.t1.cds [Oikopleura dioica]
MNFANTGANMFIALITISAFGYAIFDQYWLAGITPKAENFELDDPNVKWGQSYGCWQTEDVKLNLFHEKRSECLFQCAHLGFHLTAFLRDKCACITEEQKALFQRVSDEECEISCVDEWDMSCGGLKGEVSIYRTPLVDKRCETIKLGEEGQFKKIMLASFPGSGNTWTRYVIERATGYFTGAVANDSSLFAGGFVGEYEHQNAGTTILVKGRAHRNIKEQDGAVLLIRNPFDAILAEFNRNHGGGHTGHAAKEAFYAKNTKEIWPGKDKRAWYPLVLDQANRWYNIYSRYLTNTENIHVIYFEEMKENLGPPMRRVVDFLDVEVVDFESRLKCLLSNTEGSFKRTKQPLDFDPFAIHEDVIPGRALF